MPSRAWPRSRRPWSRAAVSASRAPGPCGSTPRPSSSRSCNAPGSSTSSAGAGGSSNRSRPRRGWWSSRRTSPTSEVGTSSLNRDSPEREPALELRLDRQGGADPRLQPELALVVALLGAGGRDEGVEAAALVVVDEVDPLGACVVEAEHRAQDAIAVAAGLDRGRDRVDPDHEVLHVGVGEDHPAVAELVVRGGDGRARLLAGAFDDLLHVLDDAFEVGGR